MFKESSNYTYQDIEFLAKRWDLIVGQLNYPSRGLAVQMLYHIVTIWMAGRGNTGIGRDLATELGHMAGEISTWLMEYPRAAKHCPNLIALQLDSPRLLDEAINDEMDR